MSFEMNTLQYLYNCLSNGDSNLPKNDNFTMEHSRFGSGYVVSFNDIPIAILELKQYKPPYVVFSDDINCFPNKEYEEMWTSPDNVDERVKTLQDKFITTKNHSGANHVIEFNIKKSCETGENYHGFIEENDKENPNRKLFYHNISDGNESRAVLYGIAEKTIDENNNEIWHASVTKEASKIYEMYIRSAVTSMTVNDISSNEKIKRELLKSINEKIDKSHSYLPSPEKAEAEKRLENYLLQQGDEIVKKHLESYRNNTPASTQLKYAIKNFIANMSFKDADALKELCEDIKIIKNNEHQNHENINKKINNENFSL